MSYTTHTNPLATDSEKDSEDFGLKTIKACFESWKTGSGFGGSWSERKVRFDTNRAYAVGKQSTQHAKDQIEIEGLPAQLSLDYSPLPILVPFIKRLKDKYGPQRLERIECNAIDPFSYGKKLKDKYKAIHKLKEAERIKAVQDEAGVPLEEFSDEDPQDESEINLEFGFNYKLDEEKIMESGVDIVFYDNKWNEVMKDPILMSIFCTGFAAVKCDLDANGRIKYRLIKSENFITSFCETENFSDWDFQGAVYDMRIADIRLKYPGKFSEKKLFELAQSQDGKNGNVFDYGWGYGAGFATPWDAFTVQVVDLDWKTLYNLHYEKNYDRFGKEVYDKTRKFKEGKEYQSSPPYEVTYTGLWIVDTEIMLEWGLSKNMIKPYKNLVEVQSRYAVFLHDNMNMNNTPLVETAIPFVKAMQNIHMQTQKLIAATAPDGYIVDITGLSDIDLMGDGTAVTPAQLYQIYLQTGTQYFRSIDDGDDIDAGAKKNPPISPSNTTFSNKLVQLDDQYNKNLARLTAVIGSNSLDQGNITNQAVGKGVLQDARAMSEGPTNYAYNAYLSIKNQIARLTAWRLWDILVFGKNGYDGYRLSLGSEKIEYVKLQATDDFEKTNFDIKIEVVLNDEEFKQLNVDINQSLAQKEITLADAIDCRRLAKINLKYASYVLASRIQKRERAMSKAKMEESRAILEGNTAAAEAKTRGEMEIEDFKHRNAMELKKLDLEDFKEREIMKYSGILKAGIATALLAKEGMTEADLPDYLFEGLDLVARTQKEVMAKDIADNEQAMMEEEQMRMEEEQAMQQEQQMQAQQQGMVPPEQMQQTA